MVGVLERTITSGNQGRTPLSVKFLSGGTLIA